MDFLFMSKKNKTDSGRQSYFDEFVQWLIRKFFGYLKSWVRVPHLSLKLDFLLFFGFLYNKGGMTQQQRDCLISSKSQVQILLPPLKEYNSSGKKTYFEYNIGSNPIISTIKSEIWRNGIRNSYEKEFIKVFSFFRCPLLFFTAYQQWFQTYFE